MNYNIIVIKAVITVAPQVHKTELFILRLCLLINLSGSFRLCNNVNTSKITQFLLTLHGIKSNL
jgi:hypothetical protein